MTRQITNMNRSMIDWAEINSLIQQTAALHLHITLYVLLNAQQNACLHTHVSTACQLVRSFSPQQYVDVCWVLCVVLGLSHNACNDSWEEIGGKRTIRAENEVEANKLVNNYRVRSLKAFHRRWKWFTFSSLNVRCVCQFGFRKWKSHVTERPFEDRSEVVKELYSELNIIKPHSGTGCCPCLLTLYSNCNSKNGKMILQVVNKPLYQPLHL